MAGDTPTYALSIDDSRRKLLQAFEGSRDVTYIRGPGNVGDDLIFAGTRQLLSNTPYREVSILDLEGIGGHTALLTGSGGWSRSYHAMPDYLRRVESRFQRVIVLPSSFDSAVEEVRQALSHTKAKVFARENVSFNQIRDLCDADLAHDCALYFDYSPYRREGKGVLTAYRNDHESARPSLPPGNNDISVTCDSLDEFLWTIARHQMVRTDRAHVTISAAMLGKEVEYAASNYHKVPAIVEFSLASLPVRRVEQQAGDGCGTPVAVVDASSNQGGNFRDLRQASRQAHMEWLAIQQRAREEIESLVPPGGAFILVDDNQWGREPVTKDRRAIPFLEKDGEYWGPPADDLEAVTELERLRQHGAEFLIFAWPAFWWLEHYPNFVDSLTLKYRQIWRGQRLLAFDLRSPDVELRSATHGS